MDSFFQEERSEPRKKSIKKGQKSKKDAIKSEKQEKAGVMPGKKHQKTLKGKKDANYLRERSEPRKKIIKKDKKNKKDEID